MAELLSEPPVIAVIDDDVNGARHLARLFRYAGYAPVVYHCGADALAAMAQEAPVLIILDIDMPQMTGLECLERVRADERLRAVPVIMYSGDFAYERVAEAKRLGAQEYVVKGTMRWSDFLNVVRRHLGDPDPEETPAVALPGA